MDRSFTTSDDPAPHPASAAFGGLRVRVLDALIFGHSACLPRTCATELISWADVTLAAASGRARGAHPASLPADWREHLAWAGVPLGVSGELHWGADFAESPALAMPELHGGVLRLPAAARFPQLTSLELKPLRLFIARRLGCRLQTAPGVHFYLWSNQAVLVSCAELLLGGFLYGPDAAQRTSLSLEPGGFQVVRW